MPELKLYTVAQLREWLMHNHAAEGLSERVIAPTRAWAIIHNPYVKEDDAIVAAIFEDGELAAYTASFPDMLECKRVWWASTLYCYPKFTGKGYGLIVVGSLMEAHEPDLTYDRWGAVATVEIFNHLGYQTIYTTRYHLRERIYNLSSLKGKVGAFLHTLQKYFHPWPKQSKADYTLQEVSCIDGEAYSFMQTHKGSDIWLREQDMMNWIVEYPFFESGKRKEESGKDCFFGDAARIYRYKIAKVYVNKEMHGVYMLRQHDEGLSVVFLYYTYEKREAVFDSIINQIIAIRPNSFVTENEYLYERVRESLYFPKNGEEKVSLSLPVNINITNFTIQLGDGDSFA